MHLSNKVFVLVNGMECLWVFFLRPRGFEIRVPLFPLFICYGSGGPYCALEKCRGRRFILGFNVGGRKKKGVESLV